MRVVRDIGPRLGEAGVGGLHVYSSISKPPVCALAPNVSIHTDARTISRTLGALKRAIGKRQKPRARIQETKAAIYGVFPS